ncbi:MAG: nicotinate-nucleotide adenylyltransferase [Pseudomonadota bacterium]
MILCFGGTFDPIHVGHLALARQAAATLKVPVRMVLSAWPTHRDSPSASIPERFAMLQAACAPHPELVPDDFEIRREAPSYTVDTLTALRQAQPKAALGWLIGQDSLLSLETWDRWPQVLELAHLVVLQRAGYDAPLPESLARQLAGRWLTDRCPEAPAGHVVRVTGQPPAVSSTQIRKGLMARDPVAHLLPTGVFSYIRTHRLYRGP